MELERKNIHIDIVTSSPARTAAFQILLGPDRVRQVSPHFTEDIIRKPINNQPAEWPMEMAERKALQDIAALMVLSHVNNTLEMGHVKDLHPEGKRTIRIYSDTINIAYAGDTSDETTVVLEKPKSLAQWLRDREHGAMALSGKNTEICTALTAIDMTDPKVHPATILIRIAAKMKPFTIDDAKKFITKNGPETILKSASGISFINPDIELFDTAQPLKVYTQTDPDFPPTLLFELPTWTNLSQEDRVRILYGAIPEALDILVSQFTPAYPPNASDGRKI